MKALVQTEVYDEEDAVVRQWLAEAHVLGEESEYAGKRRHPRVAWQMPITVDILDGASAGESYYATSKDISEGGMGFRCRRAVPVWSCVRVTCDDDGQYVHGQVMHCTETVGGFIVGMQFQWERDNSNRSIRRSA